MRTRITAAVALLTLLALTGAGAIVYLVEAQRVEDRMVQGIDQELAEFAELRKKNGLDPATDKPYASVGAMLNTFLRRNVPDENEILVTWYDGGPMKTSSHREFVDSPFFLDTVTPLVGDNGTTRIDVPGYGDALFTVQSVRSSREAGALVIVTYLEEGRAELRDTMRTYGIVALLSLLMVTAMAGWLSGRLLAPLRTLRETADDIGEGDLSQRLPVTGNDDITALTRTVNGMLGRLESAFVDQRRFLDDAGHELRTPLTVLRGHLELIDSGSPQDVVETRELLLDEVDRMSRLVGDLILLAKSDRPDFVTTRPVDLGRLTEDLLAKSRGLGDREWTLDGVADTKVTADEQRITQAVLQLADNAVKHTRPGDVVAIGSSYDGEAARLWVRDTGPGVPEADRERIFERFGRSAVAEDDEGFGLGLSIVRAIVVAHGGSVTLEQPPAGGARFVVTLSAAPPGPLGPDDPDGLHDTDDPDQTEEIPWPAS